MKFLSLIAVIIFTASAQAQTVRLLNSTRQSWSGGIAGRHGENYVFVVEFTNFRKEPLPDTLWMADKPIPILYSGDNTSNRNTTVTRSKGRITFEIHAGTSADEYANRYPYPGKQEAAKPHCPVPCNGIALLSYSYRGKERYFIISKIMKNFPPVSYP